MINKKNDCGKYGNIKISKYFFLIFVFYYFINPFPFEYFIRKNILKKKRIGVVGVLNEQNAGNNLVKFSMYKILQEYGFDPVIISYTRKNQNIDFLRKRVKLKEVVSYKKELNEKDYDILMVNSDQTWNNFNIESLLDHGFLRFAENWTIPKFVYAASLGVDYWRYTKKFDERAKELIKKFSGISLREKGAISLVKQHLGVEPEFVLDPTFLIDQKYYLNIIKEINIDCNRDNKSIFTYILDESEEIKNFIKKASEILNFAIYKVDVSQKYYTEKFLIGVYNCNAIITDSFHGTVFSIIFNKPFISFINPLRGSLRFFSLIETFGLEGRIINDTEKANISKLLEPLNINRKSLFINKEKSIKYLEEHLGIRGRK